MHEKCQFPFEISPNSPILDLCVVISVVLCHLWYSCDTGQFKMANISFFGCYHELLDDTFLIIKNLAISVANLLNLFNFKLLHMYWVLRW